MSTLTHRPYLVASLLLTLFISACTQDPYLRTAPTHIAYKDAPASILNRGWISGSSQYHLQCMRMRGATTPSSDDERIAIAEKEIAKAKRRLSSNPEKAASNYLHAAETLWPVVRDNANPSKRAYWGDKKRLIIAHQLYTHAVGQTANLLVTSSSLTQGQKTANLAGRTLSLNTSSPGTIHPSYFDEIKPLDTHVYGNVGDSHYSTVGLGAAVIASRKWTAERKQQTPIIPPHGMELPVNAIIDYPSPGKPRLTLYNLLKTDTTTLTGAPRPLAADYSSCIAATMGDQSSFLGLAIAINPKKYKQETGLFALGPYDPDKIPVIFIHGLISQPSTWTIPSNYLLADKTIRENYQFYYYFYPTGITPFISGSKLRKTLNEFYAHHYAISGGHNENLNRTVLVGHSMGGLLSSIQSREFDEDLWKTLFKDSPDTIKDPDSMIAKAQFLFNPPTLEPIERTIFVSTPHRGSELADNWIGRIGMALITLPQNVLSLQLSATADSVTKLGRSLINSDGPPSSVSRLKPNNQSLTLLNKQPFSPRVTYHSIIGDRGKNDTPDSSDGVVPYWSSHLDGVASEKIVPSNHEAHLTPEAHKELARILHLHLK